MKNIVRTMASMKAVLVGTALLAGVLASPAAHAQYDGGQNLYPQGQTGYPQQEQYGAGEVDPQQFNYEADQPPPPIPAYDQSPCPGDGYIWTPGYWAYGPGGYVWVNGAWVLAPYEGALWTPGYWGYDSGNYLWNAGYWGPVIGYYGGINYGFGYFGVGFYGGYWDGGSFFYNSSYNHIDRNRIRNIYNNPYRGGVPVHPGGRSFDPHPQFAGNRTAGFYGQRAVGGGAGQPGSNLRMGPATGFDGQPQNGARSGFTDGARPGYTGGGAGGSGSFAVPGRTYAPAQTYGGHNYAAPQTTYGRPVYPGGGQQGLPHYNPPAQQQQHFSAPAPVQHFSAPAPAQHFSAPSGGGGSHSGGGGHR